MKKQVNTRKFQVSPNIIYSLIKAQAGTLAKGILECVMNSVDAGAKSVDIKVTNKTLQVTDNGKGFRSRDEIEACFEVFGFEHNEGDRTYGQFGIGRAQLWNFCSTIWHTNTFRMDVDIKHRGLDYDLVEDAEPFQGLRIDGTFYEPLTTSDILACERELKELAMYVEVPVTLNGNLISTDPSQQKWTHETPEAWISLSNVKKNLTVYNLGVKVRDYSAYHFGCGGLVVTKPGVRLSLNMARNDILLAECKVWRKIKPFLQEKNDEEVKRSPRLNEEQLTNLATRAVAQEVDFRDVQDKKFLVDILGNKHTIPEFFDRVWRTAHKTVTFGDKKEVGRSAEESHKNGYCFVLEVKSLQRFSCNSLTELMEALESLMTSIGQHSVKRTKRDRSTGYESVTETLTIKEAWRDACAQMSEGYTEIPHKDWTKREQAAMSTLRGAQNCLLRMLKSSGAVETRITERELRLGVSEVAEAWTDGQSLIWLNRDLLAMLDNGMSGALHIANVMVHEYLHEGPSTGTHVHDDEFYERFHTATLHYATRERWGCDMGDLVSYVLTDYLKECSKRKVALKSRVVVASDKVEAYQIEATVE
jgi:hypothetical protein